MARSAGIDPFTAIAGAGAYGLLVGSENSWGNVLGFFDTWQDTNMILRGYFYGRR